MITGLTITDFLSLNFYKFGILQLMKRMKISDEDASAGIANYSIHLLSYPQCIVITSIPY